MITPSFGPTATERVLPKLSLDFTTASLDSRVTFTRSGNTATRVNSSGHIETVAANVPRFDFDPVTLACKGLLIEEARSNLLLYANDFSQTAVWGNQCTTTPNSTTSPDGTSNGWLVADNDVGAADALFQSVAVPNNGNPYTFSFYYKAGTSIRISPRMAFLGGTTVSCACDITLATNAITTNTWTTASVSNAGNGWFRFTGTFFNNNTGNTTCLVLMYVDPASLPNMGNVYLYGAQLEQGAFATSYIPTEATAVTRNADVATMTGANFSDWFNAAEGAFRVSADTYKPTSGVSFLCRAYSSGADYISIRLGDVLNGCDFVSINGGVVQVDTGEFAITNNQVSGYCYTYKANGYKFSANANVPYAGTGTVPTLNTLEIASTNFVGHIQRVFYYPQALTSNENQAFSKI